MADPQTTQSPNPSQVLDDGKFWALPDADRRSVLTNLDPNFAQLSDEDKSSVLTTAQQSYQQKTAGQATISATKPLGLADQLTGKPGSWLDQAERDITQGARPGYDRTIVGKVAHALGLPRTGTAPDTANDASQFMGKIPVAPIEAVKAVGELATGHPVRAVNKAVTAVSDLGPTGIVLAPEASLPTLVPTLVAGMIGQKGAEAAADVAGITDQDYRELAGNVGGLAVGSLAHGRLNPQVASADNPSVSLARKLGRLVGRGGAAMTDKAVRAGVAAAPTVAAAAVGAGALAADQATKFGLGVAEGAGGYVSDKYVTPTVDAVKTSLADDVHQAVTNPSSNGSLGDIIQAVKEHAGNASDLIQKAPDIAKSILDKIQTKATTPQEVTSNLVDKAVDQTVNENWLNPDDQAQMIAEETKAKAAPYMQWGPGVSDAWNQVSSSVANAVRSANEFSNHAPAIEEALRAGAQDTMSKAGEVGAAIQKKMVNIAMDQYNRWTNPTASGGSFDADAMPDPKFRRGTMFTNDPQAVGPSVSSDNIPRSTVNDEVGVGPENQPSTTPLADLANREPWAKNITDGFTSGMRRGGTVEAADLRFRGTPGIGREYLGANTIFNDRLKTMYGKASTDSTLVPRAREIFKTAYENAARTNQANPGAIASQLADALDQPGYFEYKPNPSGEVEADSTDRMQLVQKALAQADKHIVATSKFQSVPAAASSLGLTGSGALLGSALGLPGSIAGAVGGFTVDQLLKLGIRKAFLEPHGVGVLSPVTDALVDRLSNMPQTDSAGAKLFKEAQAQVPSTSKNPLDYTKTDTYKNFSALDREKADRYFTYSKTWVQKLYNQVKGFAKQPTPRTIQPGQQTPVVKDYNTAENETPNLGNVGSILSGQEQES